MMDMTMTFSFESDREGDIKKIMTTVYNALKEKGYNPINQLVGYILSEDPTYITTHNNARSLIRGLTGMNCCKFCSNPIWENNFYRRLAAGPAPPGRTVFFPGSNISPLCGRRARRPSYMRRFGLYANRRKQEPQAG